MFRRGTPGWGMVLGKVDLGRFGWSPVSSAEVFSLGMRHCGGYPMNRLSEHQWNFKALLQKFVNAEGFIVVFQTNKQAKKILTYLLEI